MKLARMHLRNLRSAMILFLLLLIFGFSARSQQASPNPALLTQSQEQSRQASRTRCQTAANCFDAGPYVVTVTDIVEGDTPGYRLARLVLRFDNLTDTTLVLGYRSGSSFMVDNFRSRYSCCQADSSREDTSAIGIGTDHDDKINPQFMLKPGSSDTISFDLWRHRPPDQPASYYHFDVMIDEIDPTGKTILRRTVVFFRTLPATSEGQKR